MHPINQTYSVPNLSSLPRQQSQYQNRHTLPVSKWNITKYSGDDQGLQLNEFLEIVQALSHAERVSQQELFASAVHLFTGSALKWYMTQRSTGRLMSWEHLVFELRRTYMHPDLDSLIKVKIYQRRQQRNESFHEFYFEIEKLFRTMCNQIPDHEKVDILQHNMRVDYKKQMTFIPIGSLEELISAGQKIDALHFSAYNKVFGVDKSVHVVENLSPPARNKQKNNPSQLSFPRSGSTSTASSNQQEQNRNSNPQQNSSSQTNQPPSQRTGRAANPQQQNQQATRNNTSRPATGQPQSSGSAIRPTVTLQDLLTAHAPPPDNTCFNCGIIGHHFVMCRDPRNVFCGKCGLRGFPTEFCPYCIKNGNRADENRHPPNNEA